MAEEKKVGEHDEELDIAKAVDVARNWIKRYVTNNLSMGQFKVESVKQNGDKTKYIVIVSIISDIGEDREYYLIKVDITTNKIVPPLGKGKLDKEEKITLKQIEIPSEFES